MLAAILPDGQRAWFFKVVGPIATIDPLEKPITDFFATIRPADSAQRPVWSLPAGWTEQSGKAMRAATIVIPGAGKPLELTVTSLGWPGTPEAILSNVNRWRGQMQLPEIALQQLAESTRELSVGDAKMTIVDLRGRFQAGMTAPFAGRAPFAASSEPSNRDLPADHPPVDPGASATTSAGNAVAHVGDDAQAGVPRFEAPAGWQAQSVPPGGMRKAAFTITNGAEKAEVTLIDFPADAGPKIADPLANVNRWRGEVGLAPISSDELDGNVQKIEVDGNQAIYAAMIPGSDRPQTQASRATVAAIVPSDDRVWFIKLSGARDIVAAEQERFTSFLKSIRFDANRGARDGN
jgi:hypothetical protein